MKLVAMIPVRNEADRYLAKVLNHFSEFADEIVILDDASTDNSVEVCRSFKKVIVESLPEPLWRNHENQMREQLYQMTIARNPDWILAMDADEIFEDRFKNEVRKLMESSFYWYSFNWYHLWTPDSYFRTSPSTMRTLRRLFRFLPDKPRHFYRMNQHCGSTPAWVLQDHNGKATDIRVKHLGFLTKQDRLSKIELNRAMGSPEYARGIEESEKQFEAGTLKLSRWKEWI